MVHPAGFTGVQNEYCPLKSPHRPLGCSAPVVVSASKTGPAAGGDWEIGLDATGGGAGAVSGGRARTCFGAGSVTIGSMGRTSALTVSSDLNPIHAAVIVASPAIHATRTAVRSGFAAGGSVFGGGGGSVLLEGTVALTPALGKPFEADIRTVDALTSPAIPGCATPGAHPVRFAVCVLANPYGGSTSSIFAGTSAFRFRRRDGCGAALSQREVSCIGPPSGGGCAPMRRTIMLSVGRVRAAHGGPRSAEGAATMVARDASPRVRALRCGPLNPPVAHPARCPPSTAWTPDTPPSPCSPARRIAPASRQAPCP